MSHTNTLSLPTSSKRSRSRVRMILYDGNNDFFSNSTLHSFFATLMIESRCYDLHMGMSLGGLTNSKLVSDLWDGCDEAPDCKRLWNGVSFYVNSWKTAGAFTLFFLYISTHITLRLSSSFLRCYIRIGGSSFVPWFFQPPPEKKNIRIRS